MAGTRSSARLANAKGKQVKPIKHEEVDDPMLLDEVSVKIESDYDESDEEEALSRPPRKRQRTSLKPTKTPTRKRQVRGKQGRLAGLVNMPIDIFTEITSHLLPIDIISLSRSSKFFRNLLMHRSSSHIWHGAMRNVRGLPPCPPDLSEPHYLALLFSKHCSMCGQLARCRMDEILRVRLCVLCRDQYLTPLDTVAYELRSLIHHSGKIVPSKRRWGPDYDHALKDEVMEVERQYRELEENGDESTMLSWRIEKQTVISKRLAEALDIQTFLDSIDNDREHELRETKNARRREIENRLVKLGWEKKDMQFSYNFPSRKEWYSLVEQARPLTERIWANLQPKLIPILEANREVRLQKELGERQNARRNRLAHLLNEIKKSQWPILDITVRVPTDSYNSPSSGDASPVASSSTSASEAQSSSDALLLEISDDGSEPAQTSSGTSDATETLVHTTFHGIFPDLADALEWPVVKALHEADISVNEMEQNFFEHRDEIHTAIANWKTVAHTGLAEMLRHDQDIQGELLSPHLIVQEDDEDPFANLSDDLKLLLRADSLFTGPQSQLTKISLYDLALARFGYRYSFKDGITARAHKSPLDLGLLRVCSDARKVARMLLASMGLENASAVELKSVGLGFACARCHDSRLKTWEDLVTHFLEAQRVFARVQEHADELEALDVSYRDVHDPEMFPERPLVKFTAEQNENLVRACVICLKGPIGHDVRSSEAKIFDHLKDVHDITEPKLGTHYTNSHISPSFGFDFGPELDLTDEFFPDMPDLHLGDWW